MRKVKFHDKRAFLPPKADERTHEENKDRKLWMRSDFMVTSLQTYFSLLVSYPVVMCLRNVIMQERQRRKRKTKQTQEKNEWMSKFKKKFFKKVNILITFCHYFFLFMYFFIFFLTGVSVWGKCQNPVCGYIYVFCFCVFSHKIHLVFTFSVRVSCGSDLFIQIS